MIRKTNTALSVFHPNSLFIRTAVPFTLLVMAFIGIGLYFGQQSTRDLYNHLSIETLKNDAFFVRALLSESYRKTSEANPDTLLSEQQKAVVKDATDHMMILLNRPSHGLVLLDHEGKTLLSTRSGKPAATNIDVTRLMENKTNFILGSQTPDGLTLAHSYFQPLDIHILVFNNQSFSQALSYRGMVSSTYVFVSTLTALLLVLMYILLNVSVLRPITALSSSMKNIIQQDDFNQNIPIRGSNELAQVAHSFNTLLHHLRDRDNKLHEHREQLEDLIEERTQKLLTVQKQLVQGERLAAIGEFSSSIAHELRNPLTSIKMGIEQIMPLLDHLDIKNKRRMELVQAEIMRLDSMLKGILAFAAATPTEQNTYALSEILAQAKPTFDALAKESNVTLNTLGFHNKCMVMTDKNKLIQALINLVKNACEAHSGTKPVRITASHTETHAQIQIQNGGKPIPADVMNRLFEPFFTTKPTGTGLGLPTTKRLIEEIGGTITVESTPALGTVALITLPLSA